MHVSVKLGGRAAERKGTSPAPISHAPVETEIKLEPERLCCLVCSQFCILDLATASLNINEEHHSLVKESALYNLKRTTCQ